MESDVQLASNRMVIRFLRSEPLSSFADQQKAKQTEHCPGGKHGTVAELFDHHAKDDGTDACAQIGSKIQDTADGSHITFLCKAQREIRQQTGIDNGNCHEHETQAAHRKPGRCGADGKQN